MNSPKEIRKTIECYSVPMRGHATPLLKIIEILLTTPSKFSYDITFMSSKYFIEKVKSQYKHIKMLGIQDGLTEEKHFQLLKKLDIKTMTVNYVLRLHKQFFEQKTNHPDLIICDFFSQECILYARKFDIKYIINCPNSYDNIKDIFGFPSFSRSFSIAGFTIIYPFFLNPFIPIGLGNLPNACRYSNRILFNSTVGLDRALTMPTNHTFTGLLNRNEKQRLPIDNELKKWIQNWKAKGKNKFIYISFGSIQEFTQQFALKLKRVIETTEYPTIWSLRGPFVDNFSSDYIYHRKWLPQQSILALEEVKCYMTHCGWGSITEAVSHQVPLIGVPFFGDQPQNAQLVTNRKIGIQIYKCDTIIPQISKNPDINEEQLIQSFSTVIQDESYKKNITKINNICRSYKTNEIIIQAIENSLEFGYEHLIDKDFQDATTQNVVKTVKWLIAILVFLIIYYMRQSILGLF